MFLTSLNTTPVPSENPGAVCEVFLLICLNHSTWHHLVFFFFIRKYRTKLNLMLIETHQKLPIIAPAQPSEEPCTIHSKNWSLALLE